jgi:hexosaminidase
MRRQLAVACPPLRLWIVTVLALLALAGRARAQRVPGGADDLPLLPVPASVVAHEGTLPIDEGFTVGLEGVRDPRLTRAVERFLARLQARTGLPVRPTPIPSGTGTLQIRCSQPDLAFLSESADERYTLDVTPQGARLEASTLSGILRGLATMQQLVRAGADGIRARAVHIEDAPRFAWRGLMLDVSRHFASADVILRMLDAMESVKLNVLHLHLSDNEGFRVESRRYARLTAYPSSGGQFYTQAEIRALVAAARDRGIRVVPEFEMPGHVQSILIAYPELGSGAAPLTRGRGPETMKAALDPSREATYQFIAGLLGEMAALFPDEAMHVAGDEVQGEHWLANAGIQAFMRQRGFTSTHQLQGYFTRRVAAILATLGKTAIVWDEALDPALPKNVVVQAWRSSKMVQRAAAAGHKTIVSAGYYLDRGLPAAAHFGVDPLDTHAMGVPREMLQTVKGTPLEPYVTEAMVSEDAPALTSQERARVVGGEASMWTELVPDGNLEMHTWPRAAAVAERLWSPPATGGGAAAFVRRLELVSTDLELQGLQHRATSVRALRRLAADGDVAPLVTLAETVEPLKHLGRLMPVMQAAMAGRASTTYFPPMNRFSDAVPPESTAARAFNDAAMQAAGPGRDAARTFLRDRLEAWRDNDAAFRQTAARSSLLAEMTPVSGEVRRLAEAGLEALAAIEAGVPLLPARADALRAVVAPYLQAEAANANAITALMAPHPPHGVSIAIVSGVAALVEQAAPPRRTAALETAKYGPLPGVANDAATNYHTAGDPRLQSLLRRIGLPQ